MLNYDEKNRSVKIQRVSHANHHYEKSSHGKMLRDTAKEIRTYLDQRPDVCVRQTALGGGPNIKTCLVLAKVVGVSDYLAELFLQQQFKEIFPTTIKRILTGDCNAKKDIVAKYLERWVGEYKVTVDDESDAIAVGIAWLIQNKMLDGLPDEDKIQGIKKKGAKQC